MRKPEALLMGLALMALGAGCASVPVTIDNRVPADADRTHGRTVYSSGAGFQLFYFIPIGVNSRQARAYRQLLNNAGDAYVTDVQIQESWKYAFVGTAYRTTFRATAYPKTGNGGQEPRVEAPPPAAPVAPAPPSPAAPQDPRQEKMAALDKMKAEGSISEAEYERTKKRLWDSPPGP